MKKLLYKWLGKILSLSGNDSLDKNNLICNRSEFLNLIELERYRVHRNSHQFSILLFSVNQKKEHETIELATKISKRVRRIDQVGWYDDCRIGVLLPNTNAAGARNIGKYICSRHSRTNSSLAFETLSYPDN